VSIAWLLYLLLVGAFLALGAGAVASALVLLGRSTRWVWATALVSLVALAIAAPRSRSVEIVPAGTTITRAVAPGAGAVPARDRGLVATLDAVRATLGSAAVRAIVSADATIPAAVARPVALGWMMASALLLLTYVLVNLRLAGARRSWPLEYVQGVRVRVAPRAGPAVIGLLDAEIVVPRSLLARPGDEQWLILQHEREHLRARDHVLLGLAWLTVIVMPWHPAVWYVLARLRLAIELDCDARVLRRGAPPRSYGALLIDMAAHGAGIRVGTLALADRPSNLERRLLAMRATRSRFVLVRAGTLCAVAGLLTMVACEARIPTSAELASMDVAGAEKAAASSGAFSAGNLADADYFLDGVKMSREELTKLEGERIASMTVVKGRTPGGRDTILVVTKDKLPLLDSLSPMGMKVRRAGTVTVNAGDRPLRRTPRDPSGKQPAIMIDGKLSTEAALAALNEDDIQSVSVMKPEQSVAGDPYPDGLLAVETKAYSNTHSKVPTAARAKKQ
jgi:beta-lactamase regulating signal transducer with metallopeptidase domain